MNNRWLALIKTRRLTCHICGLLILSEKELTRDHYPVPKRKGGHSRLPSHRWCDNAHKDHLDAKNPKYLERMIAAWNLNGMAFSHRAYASLYKLQRDLVAERKPNDVEIRRSVDFLFGVPHEHRDAEWSANLKLFVGMLQSELEECRNKIALDATAAQRMRKK
ncbi:MAG: hypothetical protein LBL21_04365 [Rickettsiales bacterium]|jgi:hypothetical protein|nr:hypothetical protein [Rickettsiales bacterium]